VNVVSVTTKADALVTSLQGLELDEVVAESPSSLAEYGLDKPKNTVSVQVQGASQPLKLLVGDKTPDGNSLYAKVPSRPRVFTIPSYLESSLAKKPFDLRDRSVLHVKRDDVKGVEITGPNGNYALARDDKGEWAFTRPLTTRAGRWAVDGFLGTLEGLRMESAAAESASDLKPYGLDKPARTVSLLLADGGRRTLEIGSSPSEKKVHVREAGNPRERRPIHHLDRHTAGARPSGDELHRRWVDRVPYDEARYLLALQKRHAPLLKVAASLPA